MLVIEECSNSRAVTVFVRGSNKMVRTYILFISDARFDDKNNRNNFLLDN